MYCSQIDLKRYVRILNAQTMFGSIKNTFGVNSPLDCFAISNPTALFNVQVDFNLNNAHRMQLLGKNTIFPRKIAHRTRHSRHPPSPHRKFLQRNKHWHWWALVSKLCDKSRNSFISRIWIDTSALSGRQSVCSATPAGKNMCALPFNVRILYKW